MKDLILLVEDDPQQSESIKRAIQGRYQSADVKLVETESEFYDWVDRIPDVGPHPRVVICDVMLPWTFPSLNAPKPPSDVSKGTFRKAGLRCWKKFRQREHFRTVPWIYFTVLDEKTIEFANNRDNRTGFAQKSGPIEDLLEEMEEWSDTEDRVTKSLTDSPKMRRILIDGMNTSLGDCVTSLL